MWLQSQKGCPFIRPIFSKWPPFFEVRTLKMIEITDFNYLSVDSYVFDNFETEYWVLNFENPAW